MTARKTLRTLQQLLDEGREILEGKGNQEAELDARYLLLDAFQLDLAHFLMDRNRALPDEESVRRKTERYFSMVEMRAGRVPLQQILGVQDFMGLTFQVNAHVLIPRQDTETLVELVLKENTDKKARILDLCTGSGCIAVSLAVLGGYRKVDAVDISEDALAAAEENGTRLGGKVRFLKSDLFSALDPEKKYDIITSNPPYIPTEVLNGLEPEVKDYEPRMALDGSEDGLAFYRRIAVAAPAFLRAGGRIYLEIGYDQGAAVEELLWNNGFARTRVVKDAAGRDRVVCAELPGIGE